MSVTDGLTKNVNYRVASLLKKKLCLPVLPDLLTIPVPDEVNE